MGVVRFSISLPKDISKKFDEIIKEDGFENRSKAIYTLIKKYITESKWKKGESVAGIISILYDHHDKETVNSLLETQHDFHDIIVSSQHIHLDHVNCFEVIIVKGKSEIIQNLYRKILNIRNIKEISLNIADTK